jgi:2-polyprenyl-6-methoxyphenol hydroxylase-like FAD-dependent oxidoreductase
MGSIVVCGGSVVGLCTAMMLARDGHEVTVLEADAAGAPAPPNAWTSWSRRGVAQFHQPHTFFPRFRQVCDDELPGLTDRLQAAGCVWIDPLAVLPPTLTDTAPRPDDTALRLVTGRRPVVESVIAAAAEDQPGVTVRRGVQVVELLPGPAATPGAVHVAGVRTACGAEIRADLVVDATGRRSRSVDWLAQLGGRRPEVESEDKGFVYYTRYFTGPTRPVLRAPALTPMGSFSVLTLVGDNDTWSVTLFGITGDPALKAVRDPVCFTRVVRACPLHAHWLDGTPVTEVLCMAGVLDRYHRFVVDGQPVATGLAAVGDAWACTNPSAGRGVSVGVLHAQLLRHLVREHLDDPAVLARECHDRTERVVAPYYWNQVAADRVRVAEMAALRAGVAPPAPGEAMRRFLTAASHDADVYRALLQTMLCTALPQEVLARPDIAARVDALGDGPPLSRFPGPDRPGLLDLVAA